MSKVKILGSNISILKSYEKVYFLLVHLVKTGINPSYITVNNVHTIIEGVRNKEYMQITNSAVMAFPDGRPLSIIGKMRGKNISRIFGPTFMEKTLEWGQKNQLRHYFFGSSQDTLNKMLENIEQKFPDTQIVGAFSPPYRSFTNEENEKFISEINNAGPDLIWIGLGAPKQEIWMSENFKKLNKGIMIGIGAGFDYIAGKTKHAPEWMKNASLEWLYRLVQEPADYGNDIF